MTPEKQRIAIAEACGWTALPGLRQEKDVIGWLLNGQYIPRLHDYPNDLNAMHEAEKVLSEDQQTFYLDHLLPMNAKKTPYWELWFFCHATAAQRCEAFLKTIGKWEG